MKKIIRPDGSPFYNSMEMFLSSNTCFSFISIDIENTGDNKLYIFKFIYHYEISLRSEVECELSFYGGDDLLDYSLNFPCSDNNLRFPIRINIMHRINSFLATYKKECLLNCHQ